MVGRPDPFKALPFPPCHHCRSGFFLAVQVIFISPDGDGSNLHACTLHCQRMLPI